MNLNQITVPSLDLTKAIPFYEKLGLKLIVKSLPQYARFECPNGNSTFSIHQTENLPKDNGICIYFECENLDEYVIELTKKGIEFDEQPNDKRWLWREAKLKDIDGNQLILYYGGENRLNPPWRIEHSNDIKLYRIISKDEWTQSKKDGKVPRCNSDRRAGYVHLNKFEDIKTVANKYFEHSENPVVIQLNLSSELEKKLNWENPTEEKNWEQAHLEIENIDLKDVEKFTFLKLVDKNKFEIGEFNLLEK